MDIGSPRTLTNYRKKQASALLQEAMLQATENVNIAKATVLCHSPARGHRVHTGIRKSSNIGKLNRDRRDAESLVATLCQQFHLLAHQLLNRHDKRPTVQIADEYDVQDLVHALLKFHFDDVRLRR